MTIGIKCPSCGAEPGHPCLVDGGMSLFHQSRIRAANPRNYDSPCQKCNELQKRADDAGDQQRAHVFGVVGRPRSRWPKALRQMARDNETAAKDAGASLQFHKLWEHHDVGARVERADGRSLVEMPTQPARGDPSKQGTVTGWDI